MKDNANPDIHFNNDTGTRASSLYKSFDSIYFVVALVITRSILSYRSAATELVQKKSNDILQAYQLIEIVKAQFHDIRTNVTIFHEAWCKVTLELAEEVHPRESMPRSCNRQVHRDSQPHGDCSEYYKYRAYFITRTCTRTQTFRKSGPRTFRKSRPYTNIMS